MLRRGCFKYFLLGGECINGPVSLLSALNPSPPLLLYHFFSVALYSIYLLFTEPRSTPASVAAGRKPSPPSVLEWPALFIKSIVVVSRVRSLHTVCEVHGRGIWSAPMLVPSADNVCLSPLPLLLLQFYTACTVILPILWSEVDF